MLFASALLATFVGLAVSSPVEPRSNVASILNNLECQIVNEVLHALTGYSSATPFCSSFIHIPTSTISATSTLVINQTTTVTTTVATATATASFVTFTETDTTTLTTCIPSAYRQKRNQKATSTTTTLLVTTSTTTPAKTTSTTTSTSSTLPACVNTFASSLISTACSCLAIPTPSTTTTLTTSTTAILTSFSNVTSTITTTPTTTVTTTSTSTYVSCPTPSQCSNQGVQWAVYPNTDSDGNDNYNSDYLYSSFDPTVFKSRVPEYDGTTSTIGGIDQTSDQVQIYNNPETIDLNYFALNHHGYIFAEVTGTYTFTLTHPDDISLLWIGSKAYSGWTRDNADIVNTYNEDTDMTFSYFMVEGQYYPIRIVFGQAQGGAIFAASVAAPDGTVILTSDSSPSPYLVQYSCDGTSAPEFPAWGSET